MFYSETRKSAVRDYQYALDSHNTAFDLMEGWVESLNGAFVKANETLEQVAKLVNSIAGSPKDFSVKAERIAIQRECFRPMKEYSEEARKDSIICNALGTGGGMLAVTGTQIAKNLIIKGAAEAVVKGAVVRNLAPVVVKNIVFASAKTAFAVAGEAAVEPIAAAVIGPTGWVIGGACLVFSGIKAGKKNKKFAEEAYTETVKIKNATHKLQNATVKMRTLFDELLVQTDVINKQLEDLRPLHEAQFSHLIDDDVYRLGSLADNAILLAELLQGACA